MKSIFTTLLLLLFSILLKAQPAIIKGYVRDFSTNDILDNVIISTDTIFGTKTDSNGHYILKVIEGFQKVKFSYTGYEEKKMTIYVRVNETKGVDIVLKPLAKSLNTVTISGSKFAKRNAEEIVSLEIVKPTQILTTANNSMDDALQRVPGVDVIDNQVNIRGGSGWSYGAGSRVLVLVDDMPMLTADAGDAKWDFLPLENCEQIEILKGASSSLYGSSALNGVINFRTAYARKQPHTKIMLYNGLYGNPKEKSWKWWNKQQPQFQGGYFMHARKIKNVDIVFGSAWFGEDSYLQSDLNRRVRANTNIRKVSKKIKGLSYGINSNVQLNKSQTFFFWQPDNITGTKAYQPFGGLNDSSTTINKNQGQRINIDPYINYFSQNGTKHIIRTRWFRSLNDIPEKKQSSKADLFYGEYQFQKEIKSKSKLWDELHIVSGLVGSYSNIIGELYGNHTSSNTAIYLQLEKKIENLWLNAGVRYEINKVDNYSKEQKPVFRFGGNYQTGKATFFRASYGQGYRYPSIAERFVNTEFGVSKVFPNPALKSETGWSSEVAIKQGYKLGTWVGYADVALFWTQYKNMMEFNFNFYIPSDSTIQSVANPINYLGFKSINVGSSKINGIDISIVGQGKISNIDSRFMLAYTYMNPVLLKPDSAILANISGTTNTLKYRYKHSVKFDMEHQYKKITIGTTCLYNSFMKNIDEAFEYAKADPNNIAAQIFELGSGLPSSVHTFRNKYNKGSFVWDMRLSYSFTQQIKLSFIVKNMLNTIYSERPALIAPPRNFTLQLAMDL